MYNSIIAHQVDKVLQTTTARDLATLVYLWRMNLRPQGDVGLPLSLRGGSESPGNSPAWQPSRNVPYALVTKGAILGQTTFTETCGLPMTETGNHQPTQRRQQ